eukprot:TRINITY_DN9432_c0_g1_i2.p1 TRINITY_DN9432_c0_g1~~TRINITY_DN9432_c0_g1_i2.p1  ORF type:complete len:273 (-),score=25.17 TRINITY_DN9432_c0_g1_i2:58-876(-)
MYTRSPFSRSLSAAKAAYGKGDVEASKRAHLKQLPNNTLGIFEDGHASHGDKLHVPKELVRNGIYGYTTAAILIYCSWISDIPQSSLFTLYSTIIASLSFLYGIMHFLSQREKNAFYDQERERELWECESYLQGEQQEMVELYSSRGLSVKDAEKVVNLLSKNQKLFVDIMMVEELGILPIPDLNKSITFALAKTFSFFVFGMCPLILESWLGDNMFVFIVLSLILPYSMGTFVTKYKQKWRGGLILTTVLLVFRIIIGCRILSLFTSCISF